MKTYRELLGEDNIYIGLSGREGIEWSNFWYDRSNEHPGGRILLIGDSTARMIRSTMAKVVNSPVDMIGTSSAIDDDLFVSQIDAFFHNTVYEYSNIIVQLGHHSRIDKNGNDYSESEYEKFESDMKILVKYLKQYCNNIILATVFMSVRPFPGAISFINHLHIIKEKPNEEANFIKERKNKIIRNVALRSNVKFADVCDYMQQQPYVHIDHIHYERRAKKCIVDFFVKYLEF